MAEKAPRLISTALSSVRITSPAHSALIMASHLSTDRHSKISKFVFLW